MTKSPTIMDFGDKNDKVVMLNKLMNEIERGGRNPKTDPSHSDLMNMVTQNHRMYKQMLQ